MIKCILVVLAILVLVESDVTMDSFNNAFYVVNNGVGYYVVDSVNRAKPDRGQFWRVCEQIELMEDAYEHTGSAIYKTMIGELINGLNQVVSGTNDWASWNIFNDDIMWGVIALVRSINLQETQIILGKQNSNLMPSGLVDGTMSMVEVYIGILKSNLKMLVLMVLRPLLDFFCQSQPLTQDTKIKLCKQPSG